MSERIFRLVLGAGLLLLLFLQKEILVHAYIGLLIFEGISNWRMPIIISRLRYGKAYKTMDATSDECQIIPFDAERALRLIVATLLIISYVVAPQQLWFFPWFVGFILLMAGLTNICPMSMSLRWIGFR